MPFPLSASQPMRSLAPWLPSGFSPLVRGFIERVMKDIGIVEMPPGSNRSGRIDSYNLAVGVPVGSFWCASAVSAWANESGMAHPGKRGSASCDQWLTWGRVTGRSRTQPSPGYVVLYGKGNDARHIGVVIRSSPVVLSVEGNTTVEGGFDRNGIAVALKLVDDRDPVLGYVDLDPGFLGGTHA